jgi:hypothetical protein
MYISDWVEGVAIMIDILIVWSSSVPQRLTKGAVVPETQR